MHEVFERKTHKTLQGYRNQKPNRRIPQAATAYRPFDTPPPCSRQSETNVRTFGWRRPEGTAGAVSATEGFFTRMGADRRG